MKIFKILIEHLQNGKGHTKDMNNHESVQRITELFSLTINIFFFCKKKEFKKIMFLP